MKSHKKYIFVDTFLLVAIVMIFLAMEMVTREGSLKSGNSEFTYSELVTITHNFSSTIGQGGFGNVHLGTLVDGTQVAVKLRSQSSMQGSREFQAEVRHQHSIQGSLSP